MQDEPADNDPGGIWRGRAVALAHLLLAGLLLAATLVSRHGAEPTTPLGAFLAAGWH